MEKFLTGLKYGTWKTRLYVLSIPIVFLISVGVILTAFLTNQMLLLLIGIAAAIGGITLIMNYDIDVSTVHPHDTPEQQDVGTHGSSYVADYEREPDPRSSSIEDEQGLDDNVEERTEENQKISHYTKQNTTEEADGQQQSEEAVTREELFRQEDETGVPEQEEEDPFPASDDVENDIEEETDEERTPSYESDSELSKEPVEPEEAADARTRKRLEKERRKKEKKEKREQAKREREARRLEKRKKKGKHADLSEEMNPGEQEKEDVEDEFQKESKTDEEGYEEESKAEGYAEENREGGPSSWKQGSEKDITKEAAEEAVKEPAEETSKAGKAVHQKPEKESTSEQKEEELLAYDEVVMKKVFYRYKVKRDHKMIMIDSWEERKISQTPAYVWLTRGQFHVLTIGQDVQTYSIPLSKTGTLNYKKGVICKASEEYPQFRKDSLVASVFKPYLPVYHEGNKNHRPVIYKNLFAFENGMTITNTSAKTVIDMLHPKLEVDDIVTRDVRHNDYFREIYKQGVLFREQIYSIKEYQAKVNDILQQYVATCVSQEEFEDTLQSLYQNKLISEEYVMFYLQYWEKQQARMLEEASGKAQKKRRKK